MIYYSIRDCQRILKGCKEILKTNTLIGNNGICLDLYKKLNEDCYLSFDAIRLLMDDNDRYYCKGISPPGILSDERVMFLLLIVDNTPRELQQLLESDIE